MKDIKFNFFYVKRSSTIYNPFLYAWLNDNFRKEFRQLLPCLFRVIDSCRSSPPKPITNIDNAEEEERFETARHHVTAAPTNLVEANKQKAPAGLIIIEDKENNRLNEATETNDKNLNAKTSSV